MEFDVRNATAPLPPPGSPEEEAELLQGLLAVTPGWDEEMNR